MQAVSFDFHDHDDGDLADADQRVFLNGVSWEDYERLLEMRGESAAVRIAYSGDVVELMSPSTSHEILAKVIARLLEAYAEERDIPLNGIRSWTLKRKRIRRGVEPDECYSIGKIGKLPDIAIEVIWTHGGLDKLELYRRLGVKEVWVWRRGVLKAFVLAGGRYEERERSSLIPDLDLAELLTFVDANDQTGAVRRYRQKLRGG